MNGETLIWFFNAFSCVPLLLAESQYECGAHGRFEYCIDDIPGCVIGCHCHPGYYFDTDTKICEPNIKLTQDFRRQYLSEPTRIHVAPVTLPPAEQPITSNAVDEKIDEITKDADDLGDWLYNQFFKTIENQVINKTQGEELPPTRRSGNVLLNKPVRRSHKYWKGKKKKKKKSKGLKNKLLRITEDDSLFDSDSRSTSYETSSSSQSDDSSSDDDKSVKKKKDDHGHKKILIYNKKPQPPLPSFIFLPNMETPYYPPIGLPPPPVMPMYPMVPVPPMVPGPPVGGPLFPYPGVPSGCEEDETKSSTVSTDATSDTTFTSTTTAAQESTSTASSTTLSTSVTALTEAEPDTATTITTIEDTDTTSTESAPLRLRHKKRKKPIGRTNNNNGDPMHPMTMRGNRNKQLLKKLREKLSRKNKLESFFVDQYQEPDSPMEGNDPTPMEISYGNANRDSEFVPNGDSEFVLNRDFMKPNRIEMPPQQDVDFKYLAELIHKADLNKTLNTRPSSSKHIKNIPENEPVIPLRRNYNMNDRPMNNVMRQRSRMEDPNDSFYANLGKQIASMIRKIDTVGDREVNIEIEGENSKPQSQTSPVFNENNYASRSYWERSVRSPLKLMSSFKKEMDQLKRSNEDLFSLENKVEIAASTTPTLSLHDIENIISTVKKVQQLKPKRNIYTRKIDNSNVSFKFSLLPGNSQIIHPTPKPKPVQSFRNKGNVIIHELNTRRKQSDNNEKFLLSEFRQLSPDYNDPITNTGNEKDSFQNMRPTRKPSANSKLNEITQPTNATASPLFKATENKSNPKYQPRPVLLNHRSLNYHNHNQYQFEKAPPIQYSGLSKSLVPYGKKDTPSYFHHEFHHFDYFDYFDM